MNFRKARKVAATSIVAAAGVLVLGAFGSPALAAENTKPAAPVTGAVKLDPRCDCLPGPAPLPEPAPAPEQPAPEQPAPSAPSTPAEPAPSTGEVACPAQVPSNPTGADYVNAWNQSGTCLGAGAAGLLSSAWAGAIPSIVQGALNSLD